MGISQLEKHIDDRNECDDQGMSIAGKRQCIT